MSVSIEDNNAVFNNSYFWVNEFVMNNFTITRNIVAHKLKAYKLYQKYALKHNRGELTLEQFNNEMIRHPAVECKTYDGDEYYTNLEYDPRSPDDDDFFKYF